MRSTSSFLNRLKKLCEQWLFEITKTELDVRDKWLGIKFIKQNISRLMLENYIIEHGWLSAFCTLQYY